MCISISQRLYLSFVTPSHVTCIYALVIYITNIRALFKIFASLAWYQSDWNTNELLHFFFFFFWWSSSSTFTITNEASFAYKTLGVISVTTQDPLKLTRMTYFIKKKQFDAILIGYDLYRFIDRTFPCPSSVLSSKDKSLNSDYKFWICQDSLLLSAILASLSRDCICLSLLQIPYISLGKSWPSLLLNRHV